MTKRIGSLLKISLSTFAVMGLMAPGFSQNLVTNSNQSGAGNAVVYNQSGMGTSIIIVSAILIILLVAFKYFGKLMAGEDKKTVQAEEIKSEVPVSPNNEKEGEVRAAIAMSLYLYSNELHDQENPVITMIRVSRTYSPWSSKIYGLRKLPR